MSAPRRLAVFVPDLKGGGTERVMSVLAGGFAGHGHRVDLVLARAEGPFLAAIPPEVRIVELGRKGVLRCLPDLVRYLRRERPDTLFSAMSHANVVALLANRLAGSPSRVVVSERTSFVETRRNFRSLRDRTTRLLMRATYRWADSVIVVAEAIIEELHRGLRLDRARLRTIPNPVVTRELRARAEEEPACPLFGQGRPVILAAGRLSFEKDFHTLLRAFALVRHRRDAALVIIGEGPDREGLERLARSLGVADHFALPGFVANPYAYMRAASLFVLSSRFEGMPGVVVQAMACGTPIVSTDCRTGPREILEDGKWGELVPVGDPIAIADAILASLSRTDHPDVRVRAQDFEEAKSVLQYLDALIAAPDEAECAPASSRRRRPAAAGAKG